MPAQLVLYGTSGCHLCDEALEVLAPVAREFALQVIEVDICSSEQLERLYEKRIPVASLNRVQLDWPFTAAQVRNLLLHQQ